MRRPLLEPPTTSVALRGRIQNRAEKRQRSLRAWPDPVQGYARDTDQLRLVPDRFPATTQIGMGDLPAMRLGNEAPRIKVDPHCATSIPIVAMMTRF